jgi:hypothetical protein
MKVCRSNIKLMQHILQVVCGPHHAARQRKADQCSAHHQFPSQKHKLPCFLDALELPNAKAGQQKSEVDDSIFGPAVYKNSEAKWLFP